VARLCAAPQSGNYFGVWGNAASGNTNPLFFTVTNPNPIVSSLFATLGANQVALNVLPIGNGNITVTPRANVYTAGASVMLAASPDPGQTFLGWTGNAGGTQNPLILTMNQSKAITGNFTEKPTLSVQNGLDGMTGNGFRLTLSGDPGSGYRIDGTTNLTDWQAIGTLTNVYGVVQFTDPAGTNLPRRFYRAGLLP
jgi:hypothetical protein